MKIDKGAKLDCATSAMALVVFLVSKTQTYPEIPPSKSRKVLFGTGDLESRLVHLKIENTEPVRRKVLYGASQFSFQFSID